LRQDVGNLLADPEPEDGGFLVGTHHVLGQHHVGEIDFLYVIVGVSRFHRIAPWLPAAPALTVFALFAAPVNEKITEKLFLL
jgi:hypothetical protein